MQDALEQAKKELAEERYREQVEQHKTRLRNKRTLWHKLIPFTITIHWRNNHE